MTIFKNNYQSFFEHPLMENNITKEDVFKVIGFLKNNKDRVFTQSKKVSEFESKWSRWLGVKYSVFVNSGSSANLLSILALKILRGNGEVIVPSLTWISDIASVIQNGLKPVFVDINPKNLCMDEKQVFKKINKKTKAVFLSHIQGFNGLSDKLIRTLKKKKIALIEDVCESHGATFKNKKLGTFGLISNFSFYYAHHLSTVEGGMVCTNNKKIYHLIKMLRSHGMLRESGNAVFEKKLQKRYNYLSPKFIFLYPAYNFRNTEIPAVIGINQLKRLDVNNKIRSKNLNFFLKNINDKHYRNDYDLRGNSNYAFPLVLKKANLRNRDLLETTMKKNRIEFRRGNAGGGNQLRQPYLKQFVKKINFKNFPQVDHIHFFGYYIGNYPSLKKEKILNICNILNKISYE
jgi:CDP-6-deoxy-D-xylo-4-hexulose-3-dehydrase